MARKDLEALISRSNRRKPQLHELELAFELAVAAVEVSRARVVQQDLGLRRRARNRARASQRQWAEAAARARNADARTGRQVAAAARDTNLLCWVDAPVVVAPPGSVGTHQSVGTPPKDPHRSTRPTAHAPSDSGDHFC